MSRPIPCIQSVDANPRIELSARVVDLSGQRFGRLLCIRPVDRVGVIAIYLCKCDCGRLTRNRSVNLKSGIATSCGCYRRERTKQAVTKHGMYLAPIYKRWTAMIQRCTNPNNTSYHKYGARGITVCDRWMNFDSFYEDMGDPPCGMTLERIDNDGPYCLGNCKWATPKEQAFNTRKFYNCRKLTLGDKTMSIREWSEHSGVQLKTIYFRIESGWPVERVLSNTKWGNPQ